MDKKIKKSGGKGLEVAISIFNIQSFQNQITYSWIGVFFSFLGGGADKFLRKS